MTSIETNEKKIDWVLENKWINTDTNYYKTEKTLIEKNLRHGHQKLVGFSRFTAMIPKLYVYHDFHSFLLTCYRWKA